MIAKLAQLVEREADFLLRSQEGLGPDSIKTLEALCRCARALKVDEPPAPPPAEGVTSEDLALVDLVG